MIVIRKIGRRGNGVGVGVGLTVKLHPLLTVNISDHHTSVKSQTYHSAFGAALADGSSGGAPSPAPPRVFGCVIGVQRGRTVEIFNSFELLYDPVTHSLDRSFLEKKQELCNRTPSPLSLYSLGWTRITRSRVKVELVGAGLLASVRLGVAAHFSARRLVPGCSRHDSYDAKVSMVVYFRPKASGLRVDSHRDFPPRERERERERETSEASSCRRSEGRLYPLVLRRSYQDIQWAGRSAV
ncbi:hypothetical protein B296_00035633 [Ensete ventricosum]|uniref:JAB1/MPN/MOV34 metalloenzyme domain-containing protein n=1 Tax=Ensete ventricosum TaxID=4639 RepID=A0A426XK38_ENSVE|nr:hypothetical protein B296_00035633 [Ensete ventricosum]